MSDLSDLELVAQAMAPTNRAAPSSAPAPELPRSALDRGGKQAHSGLQPRSPPREASSPPPAPAPAPAPESAPHIPDAKANADTNVSSNPGEPLSIFEQLQIDVPPELLASLSPADRAALQPIIDALGASLPASMPLGRNGAGAGEGEEGDDDNDAEDEDGDDADEDDPRVAELLRQMDAAGDVADDLEGRLDRLIAALGRDEVEIGDELEGVDVHVGDGDGEGEGDGKAEKVVEGD